MNNNHCVILKETNNLNGTPDVHPNEHEPFHHRGQCVTVPREEQLQLMHLCISQIFKQQTTSPILRLFNFLDIRRIWI